MKPPSGGPTTGPRIAGTVRYDIAVTSSDLRTILQHDQTPDRHHHRAAEALRDARGDQLVQRMRDAAQNRADGEDDDRGAKNGARAEAIRHPSADRNEDREAQQIRRDREVEANRILVHRMRDGWERGRNHRRIEHLHEQRASDDQRRELRFGQV